MFPVAVPSPHYTRYICAGREGGSVSIFSKIKDAIFGNKAAARPNAPSTPAAAGRAPSAGAPSASQPRPTQSAPQPVDVEAVLQKMAADNKQQLNWRTSIVDLMKLVGMDSSFENRKELARELGYTGDTGDSAAMNIWLHKRVMKELATHGGKVPANMLD
jgi:3-oxoacyl-ACP reductase-like protein